MDKLRKVQFYLHFHGCEFQKSFRAIGPEVTTIAALWQMMNSLPPPSMFTHPNRCTQEKAIKGYSVFLTGIEPSWEDPVNLAGGEVCYRNHVPNLDVMWEFLVLDFCGQQLDSDVVGVRMIDNSRKATVQSKLEIWYKRPVHDVIFEQLKFVEVIRAVRSEVDAMQPSKSTPHNMSSAHAGQSIISRYSKESRVRIKSRKTEKK
jgi:hypothetical protein